MAWANGVVAPKLAAFLPRIQVIVNDELSARYPMAWPARLTLTLVDGTLLQGGSDYPRGNPENPMTTAGLEERFRSRIVPRYDSALAERAIAFVQRVERVSNITRGTQKLLNSKS